MNNKISATFPIEITRKKRLMDRISDNIKREVKEKKPRCAICGRFIGVDDIMNDEITSVVKQDNHFRNEQQWYEHKSCRNED